MSKLTNRTEVGTSDKGLVFVHEFQNQNETRYEVRCGNHTILTTDNQHRAFSVAHALAGNEEPVAETTSSAETVVAPGRRR